MLVDLRDALASVLEGPSLVRLIHVVPRDYHRGDRGVYLSFRRVRTIWSVIAVTGGMASLTELSTALKSRRKEKNAFKVIIVKGALRKTVNLPQA